MPRRPKAARFPNRLKELREARGWSQADLAAKLNTTNATISRRESGARDLKASDLEPHLRALGATYTDAFPGARIPTDDAPVPDMTDEINRLVDELAVDLLEQMPPDRIGKTERVRILRTATERFRAAATELLVLKRAGRA